MPKCTECNSVINQNNFSYDDSKRAYECPVCKSYLEPAIVEVSPHGEDLKEDCSNYDRYAYEKAANTADVCICRLNEGNLQILLIKRSFHPFKGKWAIPGGFLNVGKNESLAQAALRELYEETKVTGVTLRQLKTYSKPERDPRDVVITTMFYALISPRQFESMEIDVNASGESDAKEYRWFDIKSLPSDLAFDHEDIIRDLKEEFLLMVQNSTIAFQLVDEEFTWKELQTSYEALLGKRVTDQNFARKVKRLFDIADLQKKKKAGIGKPASLYKLVRMKDNF
jgi:8-oxo-dGTP diphosphatase